MKREKGEEDDIVDKNLRGLQALSWNITLVALVMAATTKAASPSEQELPMYLGRVLSCQRQKFVDWQVGTVKTGVKADTSTSADWWGTQEQTILNSSSAYLQVRMHEHACVWVTYGSFQEVLEKYLVQFLTVLNILPWIPSSLPVPLWCVLLG